MKPFHSRLLFRFSAFLVLCLLTVLVPVRAFAEQATVTGSEVNVRSGPGLAFSITASLKRGAVVEVLNRDSGVWYQISWADGSGYMSSSYLLLESAADADHAGHQQSSGTTFPVTSESGRTALPQSSSVPVVNAVPAGSRQTADPVAALPSPVIPATPAGSASAASTVLGLAPDAEAGSSASAVLGLAPSEAAGPVSSSVPSSSGLPDSSGSEADAQETAPVEVLEGYVSGNSVRLREEPSVTARIITDLNYGTALQIMGTSGAWTMVVCGGQEGYIASDYVREGHYDPAAAVLRSLGSDPGKEIASFALSFVGSPYSWGGNSPATGFDCSGFVQYIFSQYGYSTSRVANDVTKDGIHVDPADLQPGDVLCFYSGNGYVGHVGIYVGSNTFVHAANSVAGVVTTSLESGYYATRGYEIRRII